jgi:3-oxoacyl-[acyl-carrier protein] reductase
MRAAPQQQPRNEVVMGILDGKVAIVTGGAGRTCGAAISLAFAKEGAAVVVADIDKDRAERVVGEIKGTAFAIEVDVAKSDSVDRMVEETVQRFGSVSILANVARNDRGAAIEYIDEALWDETMGVRLHGTLHACRAVIPHMRKQGWGRVVNMSSLAAYQSPEASKGIAHIAAADAGVVGLSRTVAMEVGAAGITVNVIAPSLSQTVQPDEIAGTLLYLVGPHSDRTSGMVVHMNGGRYFPL